MTTQSRDPFFPAENYKRAVRRKIKLPDGSIGYETRPIQASTKMVDPNGHVLWIVLFSGPSQFALEDGYRTATLRSKKRAGFVLLGECPQTGNYEELQHLPEEIRGRPVCKVGANGGKISWDDPCKCVADLIVSRRAANKIRMEKIEGGAKTKMDRWAATQEALLEETRRQNDLLSGRAGLKAKPSKESE